MPFGKKHDESDDEVSDGRYDATLMMAMTGGGVTKHLNKKAAEGWKLIGTAPRGTDGMTLFVWERQ